MSKSRRARLHCLAQNLEGSIGVAEADFESKRNCQLDCFDSAWAFRGEREQARVVVRHLTQLMDVLGGGIPHQSGVVRAMKARFRRQKWSFDVPAYDGGLQLSNLRAQGTQMAQSRQKLEPIVRDQRQEKTRTPGGPQLPRRREQV